MSAPRFLVAPDAFKGTFSAGQVCDAVAAGLSAVGAVADCCPVADGGEGTAEIVGASLGGERVEAEVRDPLGSPVSAAWWLRGHDAYIDLAEASGLGRLQGTQLDPVRADTYGTGELIAAARLSGASRVFVAAGGSATVDGGAGAIAAIEAARGLGGCRLTVLCDVTTRFEDAARVFGPQKGATPELVEFLGERLDALAEKLPSDPRGRAMTGAAGGFAGGMWATYGAELRPGSPFVLDAVDFDARLRRADAVIVGEGRLDEQSFAGKVLGEIAARAARENVPVHAVVGSSALADEVAARQGLASVIRAGDAEKLRRAGSRLGTRTHSRLAEIKGEYDPKP